MIAAVLLAAGESRRMGRPKLVLPWGEAGSVIAHVVGQFLQAGASPIVVVTGGDHKAVKRALGDSVVEFVHNPDHRQGGMLSSIQAGMRHLQAGAAEAALLAPADLPSLRAASIQAVLDRRRQTGADLIATSFQMRRGHPVLIGRTLWQELLDLDRGLSLRDFLRRRAEQIDYLVVEDRGVIADVDTPEDYQQAGPGGPSQS